MGLFDNIFLDEGDAAVAVVEPPQETPSVEATTPTEGAISDMLGTPLDISAPTETTAETGVSEVALGTETNLPEIDTGVSFDIGGDFDFSGTDTTSGGINPEITTSETITSDNPAIEASSPEVSFSVNGVTYGASENPTEIPVEPELGSIAMIQGSTAANGINIIDEQAIIPAGDGISTTEETPKSEGINLTDSIDVDNSLMNIMSAEPMADVNPILTDSPLVQDVIDPISIASDLGISETTEPTSIQEAAVGEEDFSSFPIGEIQEEIPEPKPIILEAEKPEEIIQETREISQIDAILGGFIKELDEREATINNLVMEIRDIEKRRKAIEEKYEDELLALKLKKDYLKSKAERERSEQDKLQGVIKTFQKQISLAE